LDTKRISGAEVIQYSDYATGWMLRGSKHGKVRSSSPKFRD